MEAFTAQLKEFSTMDVQSSAWLVSALYMVGALVAVRAVVKVLGWVHTTFLATGVDPTTQGSWAIVTGATDGIGKAYSFELASRGMNVILVSRTEEKLEAVQTEISEQYPNVQVDYIVADFSAGFASGLYSDIEAAIGSRDIGILVNNVGMSYPSAVYFHELRELGFEDVSQNILSINLESATHMTAIVLPGMKAKRKGVVLNLSSANGHLPTGSPLYAGYSGAKAYVDFFTRSLACELAGSGVTVGAHLPYFVVSKMSKIRKPTLMTPLPRDWVKASLSKLGVGVSIVPYWTHCIQDALVFAVPQALLAMALTSMHKGLRKRFMKKLEGKKKGE